MSFRFTHVRHYKRGATLDGEPHMCVRCGVEIADGSRLRRNQATTTAIIKNGRYQLPVGGYCPPHTPEEIRP